MPPPTTRRPQGAAAAKPPRDAPGPDASPRYTVDQLAAAVGLPSRTIRFYQFEGVLPRPVRRGRVAFYDDSHVERLRLVAELQARGLSLRGVRHVLHHDSDDARLLRGSLGLRESLEKPWSDDRPRTVRHDELEDLVGDRPPGTIGSLVDFGVVQPAHTGPTPSYRIPSPGMLRVTLALGASGVDAETAAGAGNILRRRLGTAARELVDYFSKRAGRGFGRSSSPDEIGAALDALRPLAGEAARLIFARQIERALRERSESSESPASSRGRRPKGRGK
jgi:DNA-binding transcriptional MerR regulator